MAIIRFTDVSLSFGEHNLFDKVNFSIEERERVCIVGRNGTGKSTILKVLEGLQDTDAGSIIIDQGTVIKRLQQDPPQKLDITTYAYIAQGLDHASQILAQYHELLDKITHLAEKLNTNSSPELEQELEHLQKQLAHLQIQIDEHNYWQLDTQITKIATQLNIPLDKKLTEFSGGWLRRIELARTLVSQPNVLLLDEPTNHLDISSIRWLEQELLNYKGTIVFISHDRTFVNNIATRILELDRGQVYSHPGNFEQYIELRDKRLEDEQNQVALFEKNLAKEEVWIRKGIEARRTRNEGRVRALKKMRVEHANLRKLDSYGELNFGELNKSGKLVFDIKDCSLRLGDLLIFEEFTTKVASGNKIALVGDNGAGKTSLIKVLLQQLPPTTGTVHIGTNLKIAYFDQLRIALDPNLTVQENIFDGKEEACVNGNMRHSIGYLQDFLFTPDKARSKVHTLSGGEKNRLLLAKLLARDSNLLVLDEPTNDLDIETLELLEEIVGNYQGTVIIVSHDRSFIDNLALETWFIDHQHIWQYIGGFSDNIENHERILSQKYGSADNSTMTKTKLSTLPGQKSVVDNTAKISSKASYQDQKKRPQKLSFKETKELESLPEQMEQVEALINSLNEEVNELNAQGADFKVLEEKYALINEKQLELDAMFERWEELEEKQNQISANK